MSKVICIGIIVCVPFASSVKLYNRLRGMISDLHLKFKVFNMYLRKYLERLRNKILSVFKYIQSSILEITQFESHYLFKFHNLGVTENS